MNGISVMSCVQSSYGYTCECSGRAEKRIRISEKRSVDRISSAQKPVKTENAAPRKSAGSRRAGRKSAAHGGSAFLRTLLLVLAFTGMLAGFCVMTRASSRAKEKTWKYYTTVTVAYGEDLTDIVYRYCDSREYASPEDYVKEVCMINSLPYRVGELPDLRPGTRIVVPYHSAEYK